MENYDQDKGLLFEFFVELLLKRLYPKITFFHTSYRHDGGKDFYATTNKEKIWVEAKCHQQHLGLSKIAGSFIMADICQINCLIIFSASKVSEGSLSNLAKYASIHGKSILIFQDKELWEIAKIKDEFTLSEIYNYTKKYTFNNVSEQLISDSVNKITDYLFLELPAETLNQIWTDGFLSAIVNKFNYLSKELLLLLLSICLFNFTHKIIKLNYNNNPHCVKQIRYSYYLESGFSEHIKIHKDITAFQMFSSELILRNENMSKSIKVQINYPTSTLAYKNISAIKQSAVLLPGQCIALIHYFRALNDFPHINMLQPKLYFDECEAKLGDITAISNFPCQLYGETAYLPPDGVKLSDCVEKLYSSQYFSSIIIYGKSGVGKTRFLYELQSERIKHESNCFIFHGDMPCNSVHDFFRQIFWSYYNISFDSTLSDFELSLDTDLLTSTDMTWISDMMISNTLDVNKAQCWLTQKLKSEALTLIIDNVQMLNKDVLNLLQNCISQLRNCKSKSVIALCFNTDLMLKGSPAHNFFISQKNSAPDDYNIELKGFDRINAILYLVESLDPNRLRNDTEQLCELIVDRVGTNPLFLKQLVLYLRQQNIIGFRNNTVCILKHSFLLNAIDALPQSLYELISLRFNLFIKKFKHHKVQIHDIFWGVLLLGKLPEHLLTCINNFEYKLLQYCCSFGFLKHIENNDLVFEHQLIAKSILLLLESKGYESHPEITSIGLSKPTINSFIENLSENRYTVIRFLLLKERETPDFFEVENLFSHFSFSHIPDLLLSHSIGVLGKEIEKYNKRLDSTFKIRAIYTMITRCQNRLSMTRTKILFEDIIEYQISEYRLNQACAIDFLELLKFYMYELRPQEKTSFITKMQTIANDMLEKEDMFIQKDYEIWFLWAFGRTQMHVHELEKAKQILTKGLELAQKYFNQHQIAKLEAQLGSLSSYYGDAKEASAHWFNASKSFSGEDIYERVLHLVYEGSAKLVISSKVDLDAICESLEILYLDRKTYAYLRAISDDFICNYKILKFVNKQSYNVDDIEEIDKSLNRYRMVALGYSSDVYLRSVYKSIVFYKYIMLNLQTADCNKYRIKVEVLCEELMSNIDFEVIDIMYFMPVFTDVAELAGNNVTIYNNAIKYLPAVYKDKFTRFSQEKQHNIAQKNRGIFTDENGLVHLFHFSYTW